MTVPLTLKRHCLLQPKFLAVLGVRRPTLFKWSLNICWWHSKDAQGKTTFEWHWSKKKVPSYLFNWIKPLQTKITIWNSIWGLLCFVHSVTFTTPKIGKMNQKCVKTLVHWHSKLIKDIFRFARLRYLELTDFVRMWYNIYGIGKKASLTTYKK